LKEENVSQKLPKCVFSLIDRLVVSKDFSLSITGILTKYLSFWYNFWPILCRLISGKKNPCEYVVTKEGLRPANTRDAAIALIFQMASFLGGIPIQGGPALRIVVDAYFSKAG